MEIKERARNKALASIDSAERELTEAMAWNGYGWFDTDNFQEVKQRQIDAAERRLKVWQFILQAIENND